MTIPIIFFIVGLFIGSFLNVLILRFPKMDGLISGRSMCPKCKKTIAFYDLVPVFSYLILWGKCRYCKKPISAQYPIVEFLTGLLFFAFAWKFGLSYLLIPYLLVASASILIFVYDAKFLEIPEVFSWILLILAVICSIFSPNFILQDFLLGGLIGGGILGILVGISNEQWMGSGDIKIGLAFGLVLGLYKSLLFIFLSFIIGAVAGLVLIAFRNKKMRSEIPFAPFLVIAAVFAILWGDYLVNLYLNFAII